MGEGGEQRGNPVSSSLDGDSVPGCGKEVVAGSFVRVLAACDLLTLVNTKGRERGE